MDIHSKYNGITPYLQRFLEWSAAMNYSEQTNKTRDTCIRRFIIWCEERGLNQPQDVTEAILERYQRHYRKPSGKPLSFGLKGSEPNGTYLRKYVS